MEGYSHPEVTNLFSKVTVSARAVIHQLKQAVQESFIVLFSPQRTENPMTGVKPIVVKNYQLVMFPFN